MWACVEYCIHVNQVSYCSSQKSWKTPLKFIFQSVDYRFLDERKQRSGKFEPSNQWEPTSYSESHSFQEAAQGTKKDSRHMAVSEPVHKWASLLLRETKSKFMKKLCKCLQEQLKSCRLGFEVRAKRPTLEFLFCYLLAVWCWINWFL